MVDDTYHFRQLKKIIIIFTSLDPKKLRIGHLLEHLECSSTNIMMQGPIVC